jgi:hypothetical protein
MNSAIQMATAKPANSTEDRVSRISQCQIARQRCVFSRGAFVGNDGVGFSVNMPSPAGRRWNAQGPIYCSAVIIVKRA